MVNNSANAFELNHFPEDFFIFDLADSTGREEEASSSVASAMLGRRRSKSERSLIHSLLASISEQVCSRVTCSSVMGIVAGNGVCDFAPPFNP